MQLLFLKEQDIKMKEICFKNGGSNYDFLPLLVINSQLRHWEPGFSLLTLTLTITP